MTAPKYLRLEKGGVFARMFELRRIAFESTNGNRPPSHAVADWRAARRWNFRNWYAAHCELSQGFNGSSAIWYCHTGAQFRDERYADEVEKHIRHTGWFCDVDQGEKARGIVARLSHGRFIGGYELSDSGERVYFDEVFKDEYAVAAFADERAERVAESMMEDSRNQDMARDLENEIENLTARLLELIALRHVQCMKYVRKELSETIQSLRNKRETMANEFGDYQS